MTPRPSHLFGKTLAIVLGATIGAGFAPTSALESPAGARLPKRRPKPMPTKLPKDPPRPKPYPTKLPQPKPPPIPKPPKPRP